MLVPYVVTARARPGPRTAALIASSANVTEPDHLLAHGEAVLVPALMLLPALAIIVVGSSGMVESALDSRTAGASRT